MVMIGYIVFLCLIILYTVYCNGVLCIQKEELRQELHKVESDLAKLKMLNKLKVDWNGNPICYEGIKDEHTGM